MTSETIHYLIVPGWQGSPEQHWQSHWQRTLPNTTRVEQRDWLMPQRQAWVAELERSVAMMAGPVVLIAHSLGCVTVAHWAASASHDTLRHVRGALLVAPADVERQGCPEPLRNFAPLPVAPLPFPSLLLGSDNDAAASPQRAATLGRQWGSQVTILQGAGHINVKSGHYQWEQGFAFLYRLQALIEQQARRRA